MPAFTGTQLVALQPETGVEDLDVDLNDLRMQIGELC